VGVVHAGEGDVNYTVILPSVVPSFTDKCFASMAPELRENTMRIDNDGAVNLGVAASWNRGVAAAQARGDEWLVVCSAAVAFGEPGGLDFVEQLIAGRDVVEAWWLGWHLIAFRLTVFDRVGTFDENFWPAYWEDNDFGYRLTLSDVETPWAKPRVDANLSMFGHAVKLSDVVVDNDKLRAYYFRKWGGYTSEEKFTTPFNIAGAPLSYWEKTA
jgi:hypothetical protein